MSFFALTEFQGELSEFLSVYYLWDKVNSPRFSQNSPSLPRNSVRLSEFSSPKQYSRTVFCPFLEASALMRLCYQRRGELQQLRRESCLAWLEGVSAKGCFQHIFPPRSVHVGYGPKEPKLLPPHVLLTGLRSGAQREISTSKKHHLSEKGRTRSQTRSSVSFLALTAFWGQSSVSSFQPFVCVPTQAHRGFHRTHRVCRRTQ